MTNLRVKRVYDPPLSQDGIRVLVDRLWPRGIKKDEARIDLWLKEAAPSESLRKWFNHDPKKWDRFQERYFAELDRLSETVWGILEKSCGGGVTLLYGARDREHNNAVALARYLGIKRSGAVRERSRTS
jgi:uncharacterized protein YeaO (DUF488 family)